MKAIQFLAAALVTLLSLSPCGEAGAVKDAKKVLKKGAAKVVKDFQKAMDLHVEILEAELNAVDAVAKAGGGGIGEVYDIFDLVDAFQRDLHDAIRDATYQALQSMKSAKEILEDAGVGGNTERPRGFYFGDGGTCDELRASIEKNIEKVLARVDKRLKKTTKHFQSKSGMSVSFRLEAPTIYLEYSDSSTYHPYVLTIDVAIAASYDAFANDVWILLGGRMPAADGDLEVHSTINGALGSTTPTGDNRYRFFKSSLPEGNQTIRVVPPNSLHGAFVALGVD